MDDFLSIVVVVIFYLVVTMNGNKKRKKKNAGKKAPRTRRTAFEEAFTAQENRKAAEHASLADRTPDDIFHEDECAASRIHLHETTQQQMHEAGEGEDPCHAGSAPDAEDFSYDEDSSQQSSLADDVLRGVIMSEILTRPCERGVMRRNGRRI